MDSLASRYATALLDIAKDNHNNEAYRKEIKEVLNLLRESNELLSVFKSSFISKDEKKKVIEELFKDEELPYIKDFFNLIVDNSRANYIEEILEEFVKLSNQEDNIQEGIVYSTEKLSAEDMNKIKESLEKKLNKKIYLYNRLDSSLIGGVKVVVDEYVFDGSIKDRLKKLKSQLQEGV